MRSYWPPLTWPPLTSDVQLYDSCRTRPRRQSRRTVEALGGRKARARGGGRRGGPPRRRRAAAGGCGRMGARTRLRGGEPGEREAGCAVAGAGLRGHGRRARGRPELEARVLQTRVYAYIRGRLARARPTCRLPAVCTVKVIPYERRRARGAWAWPVASRLCSARGASRVGSRSSIDPRPVSTAPRRGGPTAADLDRRRRRRSRRRRRGELELAPRSAGTGTGAFAIRANSGPGVA